jgi:ubiquinone/menaquinone biosynthesis C-methylase UbiE
MPTNASSAAHYNQNNEFQRSQVHSFLSPHYSEIKPEMDVLDLGAGDGKITAGLAIALQSRRAIGFDIDRGRVAFARKNYGHKKTTRQMWFARKDATSIKAYPPETYGVVTSFNTLHHIAIDKQAEVFEGMYWTLKYNAQAYLLIPASSQIHEPIAKAASADGPWKAYLADFVNHWVYKGTDHYAELAKNAGLKVHSAEQITHTHKFVDVTAAVNFVKGWSPHLAHLKKKNAPEEICNQFMEEVGRQLARRFQDNEGSLSICNVQNQIILSKPGFYEEKGLQATTVEQQRMNSGAPALNTRKRQRME